tara:strand:+ start:5377 stop:5649 length:273 start_codon:yes stop_codon:yes gene_type:complete
MIDHIFREEDQKVSCFYCNADAVERWDKKHDGEKLYKMQKCGDCGKENRITTHSHGSGHDPEDVSEVTTSGEITEVENIVSKIQDQLKKK